MQLSALLASYSTARAPKLAAAEMLFAAHDEKVVTLDSPEMDKEFEAATEAVLKSTLDELERLAEAGELSSLEVHIGKLLGAEFFRNKARDRLRHIHARRAEYSVAVQEAISNVLGLQAEGHIPTLAFSNGDEAIHEMQLASALMRSWAAKEEGPKSAESFNELRTVLANFFGIELKESEAEAEVYNPRVHELVVGRGPTSMVRVLRPRVEKYEGGTGTVLIRALVEPME